MWFVVAFVERNMYVKHGHIYQHDTRQTDKIPNFCQQANNDWEMGL